MADQASRRDRGVGTARHGALRRSSTWANLTKVLVTAAIVAVLSGVATVAYAIYGLTSEINTFQLVEEDGTPVDVGATSLEGPLTILLVGSDTREGQNYNDGEEGELNDVNLLLHISADHQNATVVSFPET